MTRMLQQLLAALAVFCYAAALAPPDGSACTIWHRLVARNTRPPASLPLSRRFVRRAGPTPPNDEQQQQQLNGAQRPPRSPKRANQRPEPQQQPSTPPRSGSWSMRVHRQGSGPATSGDTTPGTTPPTTPGQTLSLSRGLTPVTRTTFGRVGRQRSLSPRPGTRPRLGPFDRALGSHFTNLPDRQQLELLAQHNWETNRQSEEDFTLDDQRAYEASVQEAAREEAAAVMQTPGSRAARQEVVEREARRGIARMAGRN